jgi:hypothetical protein
MNLFKMRKVLKIIHPIGGERIIDHLFKTPTGICFFDEGWTETSNNPIHFVDGEIRGEGPWTIGDSVIDIETDQARLCNYAKWLRYKEANGITKKGQERFSKRHLRPERNERGTREERGNARRDILYSSLLAFQ